MKKETKTMPVEKETPPAADSIDWSQEKVTGLEQTKAEDLGIPFLSICQKGSAEYDEQHKSYATKKIEGIEVGDVFNTLSRQILYVHGESKPLFFIPCAHQKLWQEWRKRNAGGGFIKSHDSSAILADCKRNEKKQDELPNGNIIMTTSYFYGFCQTGEYDWSRAIIAMTSTQLKKARAWLNAIVSHKLQGQVLPMFSHIYNLTTVPESNDEGNWFGWAFETGRMIARTDLMTVGTEQKQIVDESRVVAKQMTSQRLLGVGGEPADDTPY